MPKSRTAAKRAAVARRRALRNRSVKSAVKTAIRKFERALTAADLELARRYFREAVIRIDKAAGKGILHKNTAARKKSRLARRLNRAAGEGAS
ncbi:MAG: 30S ribosomal protein S20 [Firmicutes bacterium]|nr:30S ribosomal protein S20 [Bacillota bacterium]